MDHIIMIAVFGLGVISGLACHKPPCNIPMTKTDQERQAWLGTGLEKNANYNKPKLTEDFSQGSLYFSPLDLTILDCPSCTEIKSTEYKNIDTTFNNLFQTNFKDTTIVETEIKANYTVSGRLVSVEKNSSAQILIGSIFAPALRYDNCVWWFKIINNKTNRTILTYQLLAFGPQERNLLLSFAKMVN